MEPEALHELKSQARGCIENGAYPLALIQLRSILKETPDDPAIHTQIAFCLIQIGEPTEAEVHLRNALSIDPGHQQAASLLKHVEENPKQAIDHDIVDRMNRDALQGAQTERKKTCPTCSRSVPAYVERCGHCGYRFWKRYAVLWSVALAAVFLCFFWLINALGVIQSIRESLPFIADAETPAGTGPAAAAGATAGAAGFMPGIADMLMFPVSVTVEALVLFGVCILFNLMDRDREWNFEWKSDLLSSYIFVFIVTVCNVLMYIMINAPMDGRIRAGMAPLMGLSGCGLTILQLVLFFVLMQRSGWVTIGMFIVYIFFTVTVRQGILIPLTTGIHSVFNS